MSARTLLRTVLLFALPASLLLAQPAIPDTPAGHALRSWLDAFNSGDRTKVENYVKTVDPEQSVDGLISFHNQTGGFELLSVESSEPAQIRFRVKEKNGPTIAFGNLRLKQAQPPVVETLGLRALPPGVVPEVVSLDAQFRKRVIEGVVSDLEEFYIDGALAAKMREALLKHQQDGDYESITDGDAFASRLTKDLREVNHDKHLNVNFSPFKTPAHPAPSAGDATRMRDQMKRINCAFEKVEVFPGNIGYLKFNGFMDPAICAPTVVAAMGFLANADSVIFDLRDNGGGDPGMVTLIASYLFDKPTHLNDLYNRKEDSTRQFWTAYVPGERLATQPVFVLTSKRTFSAAEEFTYNLKNQKRATVVGETTGGGAHPVSGHVVADYFMVGVPFAKAVNPISRTNWEGTGIEPDVKVSAADALTTAQKLAAEKAHADVPK